MQGLPHNPASIQPVPLHADYIIGCACWWYWSPLPQRFGAPPPMLATARSSLSWKSKIFESVIRCSFSTSPAPQCVRIVACLLGTSPGKSSCITAWCWMGMHRPMLCLALVDLRMAGKIDLTGGMYLSCSALKATKDRPAQLHWPGGIQGTSTEPHQAPRTSGHRRMEHCTKSHVPRHPACLRAPPLLCRFRKLHLLWFDISLLERHTRACSAIRYLPLPRDACRY